MVRIVTEDFIIELFVKVDTQMAGVAKHPQAALWPSEVVTLGMLFGLKGPKQRAFYRWLKRDWLEWFPHLPPSLQLQGESFRIRITTLE